MCTADTQWSFWEGIKNFEAKYRDYLQAQIGNPEGDDKPNKKYYDPRECLRAAEVQTVKRLEMSYADLKCQKVLGLGEAQSAENVRLRSLFVMAHSVAFVLRRRILRLCFPFAARPPCVSQVLGPRRGGLPV